MGCGCVSLGNIIIHVTRMDGNLLKRNLGEKVYKCSGTCPLHLRKVLYLYLVVNVC